MSDEKTPRWHIDGPWIVEDVGTHTCGADPGAGLGHEPGCGLELVLDLRTVNPWSPRPEWAVCTARGLAEHLERDARTDRARAATHLDNGIPDLARTCNMNAARLEREVRALRGAIDRHEASEATT